MLLTKEQAKIQNELNNILSIIPNVPKDDDPVGRDESSNKEISKTGDIRNFDFKPKSHYELGEK